MSNHNLNRGPEDEKKDPAWEAFTKVAAMVATAIVITIILAVLVIAGYKLCRMLLG